MSVSDRSYLFRHMMPLPFVAKELGVPHETLRRWAVKFSIGRQTAPGQPWKVSWPAARMLAAGDGEALRLLKAGQFDADIVRPYIGDA